MAKQKTAYKARDRKVFVVLAGAILLAGLVLLILEKTNVTNFIQIKNIDKASQPDRLPDVNYSPPSQDQRNEVDRRKDEILQSEQSDKTDTNIGVRITNAVQDVPGGPAYISTILSGISSGECTLTLRHSSSASVITRVANVTSAGTYYSCDGFQIEYSALGPGTWSVNIVAKNVDGKVNEADSSLEVR